MVEQLPVQFEFRANQTFNDYFAGVNQEIVSHLQNSILAQGEPQIFLWGGAGLGKSHLLQAYCQLAHQQGLAAFYFAFGQEPPDPDLLAGLERFEVVCLDNINAITGDPVWEQALFNFYNQQRSLAHKLVLSARLPPDQLNIGLPDLQTRLNWGLTLKLKPLPDDDKIAALTFRAGQMGLEISPQVGQFLLAHFDRDLPTLWGLLEKLDKASLAAQRKLTLPFLKKTLKL